MNFSSLSLYSFKTFIDSKYFLSNSINYSLNIPEAFLSIISLNLSFEIFNSFSNSNIFFYNSRFFLKCSDLLCSLSLYLNSNSPYYQRSYSICIYNFINYVLKSSTP
jgi:hypothetical protein